MQIMLNAVTTITTSAVYGGPLGCFQATGAVSASTGAATVAIDVSNDNVVWLPLGSITLVLGTDAVADGFVAAAGWANYRARISAISGTNAAVTVTAN